MTRDELITAFSLEAISGGNAVFNTEKLDWFNQQHLIRLAPAELGRRLKPWLEQRGVWNDDYLGDRHAWFFAVLELLKPRAKRLGEFVALGWFFWSDEIEYDEAAVEKHLRAADMDGHLRAIDAALTGLESYAPADLEAALRNTAESRGVKAASLIHAVRVVVTGKTVSPGLFDVLSLLGRTRVHARFASARRLQLTSRS
jgi:glutamyl-tRNA synthetase